MRAVVVAEFKDGTAAYVSRSRKTFYTTRRNWAWVMPYDKADEMASRLNGVQAAGHYHQDVSYFRTGPCR